MVDLSQIKELRGIRPLDGGIEIGAMTTLTEVVRDPVVKEKFSLLAEGAELAASPQIRNQGTIGGNVSQDTRCWYYRSGWKCYRAGGNICFADTPTAINREHAILGADRCVAVNPSDTAPALIALDAKMVIRSTKGERVVDAEDYFIGPGIDITRMTILKPGELLTAIRIPATWAGTQFYFEKIRDRQVWDFPIVNIASAAVFTGGNIDRIRIAVNGVAAHPVRLKEVEAADHRQTAQRGDRKGRRGNGDPGRAAAALQRLQSSADAESGEASHPWRGANNMGIIEWARSPWGQDVPIHIAFYLIWVSAIAGLAFLIVHAIWVRYFAKPEEFADSTPPPSPRACPSALPGTRWPPGCSTGSWPPPCSPCSSPRSFPGSACRFPWVTYHWIAGHRPHGVDHLSHHPRHVLHGLLVDLAR